MAEVERDDGDLENGDGRATPRAFWSGTISFGLVAVPVDLFPATRSARASLRMLAPDGTPLERRYYCPVEDVRVPSDEIVRGYPIGDGEFVVVEDEELEALAPEKTRDIDLRRFVDASEIDPALFQRGYFLTPGGDSNKAYRLLAETMERTGRAGIATFVLRSKEYLVAILAENGILRAETLRFADEIRSPEDVGLPERRESDRNLVRSLAAEIEALEADRIEEEELEDRYTEDLLALVEWKANNGQDVVEPEVPEEEEREGGRQVIDLMEVLRQRLQSAGGGGGAGAAAAGAADGRGRAGGGGRPAVAGGRRGRREGGGEKGRASAAELRELTREELYERAQELDIPGRSRMTKEELAKAIRTA